MKRIGDCPKKTGDSNMKDEFDFMEPLVGWGEGIRSAEDVDIFDERPDL